MTKSEMGRWIVVYLHKGDNIQYCSNEIYLAETKAEAEKLAKLFEERGLGPFDGGYPDTVLFYRISELESASQEIERVQEAIDLGVA